MSDAQTTLLTSWEERREETGLEGMHFVVLSSGEPHTRAIFNAVRGRYNDVTGRPRPTEEDVQNLLGEKVTLVKAGENMIGGGVIVAHEGTLMIGGSGHVMLLPKRARRKGYGIDYKGLLDVIPGYSTAKAQGLVVQAREHFPKLRKITPERLQEMPSNSSTLSLCAFGTHRLPDSEQVDALFLACEYMASEDIVDASVLLVRPEHGVSEHGSMWGRQLMDSFGEVEGFEPISFAEGLELCNVDFDEAYARVMNRRLIAA